MQIALIACELAGDNRKAVVVVFVVFGVLKLFISPWWWFTGVGCGCGRKKQESEDFDDD